MKRLIILFLGTCLIALPSFAQQPAEIRLVVETTGPDGTPLHGQLLNVTSNDYIRCTFLLEQTGPGQAVLTLLQARSRQVRPLTLPDSLPAGSRLEFHFRFQDTDSSCIVRFGTDDCRFEHVFLNQRNLQFNPLPGGCEGLQTSVLDIRREKPARPAWPVILLIALILAADLALFVVLHVRNNRRRKVRPQDPIVISPHRYVSSERNERNGIYLFGGFRVIDSESTDITARFSPILRELLLLLVCYTPKGGISSEQIKTTLWYDKDEKSAVNNRSVSLFKLRNLLHGVGSFDIRSNQGRWVLEAASELVDYYRFIDLIKAGVLTRSQTEEMLTLVEAGPLLAGFNELWADTLKADVTDSILTALTHFALGLNIHDQADLLLDVCDAIAKFDSLNETALALKCKACREKGNNILSRQIFTNFQKEYQAVYGEPFPREYSEIISA